MRYPWRRKAPTLRALRSCGESCDNPRANNSQTEYERHILPLRPLQPRTHFPKEHCVVVDSRMCTKGDMLTKTTCNICVLHSTRHAHWAFDGIHSSVHDSEANQRDAQSLDSNTRTQRGPEKSGYTTNARAANAAAAVRAGRPETRGHERTRHDRHTNRPASHSYKYWISISRPITRSLLMVPY